MNVISDQKGIILMYKIAISVICYDNEEEVLGFADKLSKQKECEKIVLLVTCNKCTNVKKLINDLKKIEISSQVFEPKCNMGYLHGCLYGFKEFNEEYEWAIISNTDIEFVSDKFFVKFLDNHYDSKIGCIGPDITLKATGKHQNPFALTRPRNTLMKFRKIMYANYFLYSLYYTLSDVKNKIYHTSVQKEKGYVYGVHGSVIILRKECIDRFLEDEIQIFMYGEELYIAEILKENQLLSYYDTNLKIIHNENQVTAKITDQKKQKWCSQSISFLVKRFWK